MDLTKVTRITVVQYPEGRVFERKNLYDNGVELSVQDDGRTLKIFPRLGDNKWKKNTDCSGTTKTANDPKPLSPTVSVMPLTV